MYEAVTKEKEKLTKENAKVDKAICNDILHFMRPDLNNFKGVHVLVNPLSSDAEISDAIEEIALAIKNQQVTFSEV